VSEEVEFYIPCVVKLKFYGYLIVISKRNELMTFRIFDIKEIYHRWITSTYMSKFEYPMQLEKNKSNKLMQMSELSS